MYVLQYAWIELVNRLHRHLQKTKLYLFLLVNENIHTCNNPTVNNDRKSDRTSLLKACYLCVLESKYTQ